MLMGAEMTNQQEVRGSGEDRQLPGVPGERSEPGTPGSESTMRGEASPSSRPDVEIRATAKRRQFTAAYKRRIVEEADRLTNPGDIGRLLRREGLYSSHLASWRKQLVGGKLRSRKRGRKPDPARRLRLENEKLRWQNVRLSKELERAKGIIQIQKKISEILGVEGNPLELIEDDDAPRSRR